MSASLTVTAASRSRYPSTAATNSSARRPCRSELPLRLSSGDTSSGDTILNPNCSRRLGFQPDNAVRRRIVAVPPRRDRPPQRVPLVAVVAVVSCRSASLAAVTRCSPLATRNCPATLPHCREFLSAQVQGQAPQKLSCDQRTRRPLGSHSFLAVLGRSLGRLLRPQKLGRNPTADPKKGTSTRHLSLGTSSVILPHLGPESAPG